jgi:hypothetical protein
LTGCSRAAATILVTRNVKDFEATDAPVISPLGGWQLEAELAARKEAKQQQASIIGRLLVCSGHHRFGFDRATANVRSWLSYPPAGSLPSCAAMNMVTADRQ